MSNKKKIFLITTIITAFIFGTSSRVLAADDVEICKQKCISTISTLVEEDKCIAACTPKDSVSAPAKAGCALDPKTGQEICSLENPIGTGVRGTTDFSSIISIVIKTALSIVGALALLMLVWGGFQWLTSAGNPEKVKSGTQTMVWAIIGVVLVFSSYLLLSTFTSYLTGG